MKAHISGSPDKGPTVAAGLTEVSQSEVATANAERRRRALRKVLHNHGLRPSELAKLVGRQRANALYNLLHGPARTLSPSI
jgi:hypothetical protein